MLRMSNLPKSLWDETTHMACYLINKSPLALLNFDISERVWTRQNGSLSHLKVFGCKICAYILKKHRHKLDDKVIPYVFLSHKNDELGYKLWDPTKKKLNRSGDIIFHE